MQVGLSQQFTATVTGTTNTAVNWFVAGIRGGNSSVGTISTGGLYTAPLVLRKPVTVTAYSASAGFASDQATVTIQPAPSQVSVAISPGTASVQVGLTQQFTATVTGTTNTSVNWLVNNMAGGNTSLGTISATGLYVAPSAVPASTVTVTAQSATSAQSANAAVTVLAAPPPVSVAISPSAVSVETGATQQFTATVTGATNTSVNWLVNSTSGGSTSAGTISSTGVYTAPSAVPPSAVTVTAQSAFASTKSANAAVTVTAGTHSVNLTWNPSASDVSGYNIYRASVSGGPYVKRNPALQTATTYADDSLSTGATYFYVCTAVDSAGNESVFSNQVTAVVP